MRNLKIVGYLIYCCTNFDEKAMFLVFFEQGRSCERDKLKCKSTKTKQ